MNETRAHAATARVEGTAPAPTASLAGLVEAAQRVATELSVADARSVTSASRPLLQLSGRGTLVADATVVPAGPDLGALVDENRALAAEVRRLTVEVRTLAQTLQRQSPWWIATPNGMATMTVLLLVVGLLNLAFGHLDVPADDQSSPAAPAPVVAPAVPHQGGPTDGPSAER